MLQLSLKKTRLWIWCRKPGEDAGFELRLEELQDLRVSCQTYAKKKNKDKHQ